MGLFRQGLQLVQIRVRADHGLHAKRFEALGLVRVAHEDGDVERVRARVAEEASQDRTADIACRSHVDGSFLLQSMSATARRSLPVAPSKKMEVFELLDMIA